MCVIVLLKGTSGVWHDSRGGDCVDHVVHV